MSKSFVAGRTQDGRTVYHTMRHCNRIRREFWFTLNASQVLGESKYCEEACSEHFDVRELPVEFQPNDGYKTRHPDTFELLESPIKWALKALNAGVDPLAYAKAVKLSKGGAA